MRFQAKRTSRINRGVMQKIIFALFGCSICSYAFGTSSVSGTVTYVRVDANGHGMVTFSQTISGSPSCINSGYNNTYAFDGTSYGGRNFLALVMAAQATGATISAYGLGTCSIYGNGTAEDLDYGVNP
jgi:hypothetical protein